MSGDSVANNEPGKKWTLNKQIKHIVKLTLVVLQLLM